MRYYIHHPAGEKEGPFDLIAMMRRIRNGQLREQDRVSVEGNDAVCAALDIPEIGRFFHELQGGGHVSSQVSLPGFGALIAEAFQFMQNQPRSLIFSSSFLLLLFLVASGLSFVLPPLAVGILTYLTGMTGSAFLGYVFLRMMRGHPSDLRNLSHLLLKRRGSFFGASLLYAIASGVGLLLLVIPGVFIMAYLSLVPMLTIDRALPAMGALDVARRNITTLGTDFLALLIGLQVTLLIAGLLFGLPLLIALPLVWVAQAILYDRFIK